MRKPKQDGWYARKSFPHFDLPLDFLSASALAGSPTRVASHAFLPFIGYMDKKRRFKRDTTAGSKKTTKKIDTKGRPIKYCSHRDGYIHAFYAQRLSAAYEKYISLTPWQRCVIGYRAGLGTNVHMAKNAFDEIKRRGNCDVVAIDIANFFGSIDHNVLLKNMKKILGFDRLPDDWYKVFRSMTNYSWVDFDDLVKLLSLDKKNLPRPLCDIKKFRFHRRNDATFLSTNKDNFGIPQGSPISAVMSNVYMVDFDRACHHFAESIGAYYRRYSDDIIFICDQRHKEAVQEFAQREISRLGDRIAISPDKTEVSRFSRVSDGHLFCDKPVSYLGLTFDGRRTTLRGRTLSRYYRRMTYAARHAVRSAYEKRSYKVFKRKLFRQFTHLGKSNFFTYAKRASVVLGDVNPTRQLRRHFPVLQRKLRRRGR